MTIFRVSECDFRIPPFEASTSLVAIHRILELRISRLRLRSSGSILLTIRALSSFAEEACSGDETGCVWCDSAQIIEHACRLAGGLGEARGITACYYSVDVNI